MTHRMFRLTSILVLSLMVFGLFASPKPAMAQVTAFKQAVAEAAALDKDIAAFYRANSYKSIWTGRTGRERSRRQALIKALSQASAHGLPAARYDVGGLQAKMKAARGPRERGAMEVELSGVFLHYARDLQTGVLVPSRVVSAIVRQVPYRDRTSYLVNFAKSSPTGFFKALAPKTMEYNALMKEKLKLEHLLAKGGWGATIPAKSLKPGQSGGSVVAMRNRLMAMGYMKRTSSQSYDDKMKSAVQQFQLVHGMSPDGVAGPGTISEMNKGVQSRMQSIIVAMERERWLNQERGKRHVLVNIPDFTAKIIDNNKVTFETRSVVGANKSDRPTPEFSDVMEYMVINPSWYVPRSIVTKEYLPALKLNSNAVRHIEITDSKGRKVNRSQVNFAQYNEKTFPFSMRQPPSKGNALGLVKFIFPNPYNIYLHDTPSKNLFGREVRTFSHGCVRLADPFDFAYALLAKQTSDPKGYFKSQLATGTEQRVNLKNPVPVHIIYRTAYTNAKGHPQYRRDIYGRDGQIWNALAKAGVALRAVQG
jgi:murein L,D-transpeptidase YcbB/YkuD